MRSISHAGDTPDQVFGRLAGGSCLHMPGYPKADQRRRVSPYALGSGAASPLASPLGDRQYPLGAFVAPLAGSLSSCAGT